jgi:transcriptional regulator with XRE-family HTH domain
MTDTLTKAVVKAIESAPCSMRALAKEAGLSPAMLTLIKNGKRRATPEVASDIADALAEWADRCKHEASRLRRKIKGGR